MASQAQKVLPWLVIRQFDLEPKSKRFHGVTEMNSTKQPTKELT